MHSTMRLFLIQTSHRFCSFLPYLNLYFCSFSHFCNTNNIVLFQYSGRWKHALSLYNCLLYRIDHIVCTHRLFYFSFRCFRKHRRARSARTSCRFVLYHAGLRDFEKIEGMWTGYWPHYETCSWREFHNVGTVQSKQYAPMWYAE